MTDFNPLGLFVTETALPAQLREDSLPDTILRLMPNGTAQIYALMGEFGNVKAKQVEHGYTTKTMRFPDLVVDDADNLNSTDTTLVVDDTDGAVEGMVYQVPATGELIRIASITNATTVVIQRGVGRIAAGNILNNAVLFGIGVSLPRASDRPKARSIPPVYVPNYTVIVRTAWALSGTDKATVTKFGWENVAESRKDAMMIHSQECEAHIIWGQPKAPTADPVTGTLKSSTQGIIDAIKQYAAANSTAAGGTTTYAQMVAAVEDAFQQQSDVSSQGLRVAFMDNQAMKVFNDLGRLYGEIQMTMKKNAWIGMRWTEFVFYLGDIMLKIHPLMNGVASPAGECIILDLPTIRLAFMEGRNGLREEFDIKGNHTGKDAVGGSITTEFATEVRSPGTCAHISGLTAAA